MPTYEPVVWFEDSFDGVAGPMDREVRELQYVNPNIFGDRTLAWYDFYKGYGENSPENFYDGNGKTCSGAGGGINISQTSGDPLYAWLVPKLYSYSGYMEWASSSPTWLVSIMADSYRGWDPVVLDPPTYETLVASGCSAITSVYLTVNKMVFPEFVPSYSAVYNSNLASFPTWETDCPNYPAWLTTAMDWVQDRIGETYYQCMYRYITAHVDPDYVTSAYKPPKKEGITLSPEYRCAMAQNAALDPSNYSVTSDITDDPDYWGATEWFGHATEMFWFVYIPSSGETEFSLDLRPEGFVFNGVTYTAPLAVDDLSVALSASSVETSNVCLDYIRYTQDNIVGGLSVRKNIKRQPKKDRMVVGLGNIGRSLLGRKPF